MLNDDTGLGKDVKGEGLVGLTRGLMYALSKRAVVSLWQGALRKAHQN